SGVGHGPAEAGHYVRHCARRSLTDSVTECSDPRYMPHALLISTYDMGRQPFGLASPAAWLRDAGWSVMCVDVAKERLRDEHVAAADLVGFHLPMHTATRLA